MRQLRKLRAAEPKFVTTMVVQRAIGQPRPTHVHLGGDFTRKGEPVEPGVPARICLPWRMRAPAIRPIAWTWRAGWSIAAIR